MRRIVIVVGLGVSLLAGPALAQSSASFGVGVTIGKTAKPLKPRISSVRFTWGAAAISVAEAGYSDLNRNGEAGGLYWFTARKGDGLYRVAVSARTGVIAKVIPA